MGINTAVTNPHKHTSRKTTERKLVKLWAVALYGRNITIIAAKIILNKLTSDAIIIMTSKVAEVDGVEIRETT